MVIFQFAYVNVCHIAIVFDHLCGWHFFHQKMGATQKNTKIYPQNDAEKSHQMFPFQACFRGELLRAQLRRSPEAWWWPKKHRCGENTMGMVYDFFENLLWKITKVTMFFIGKPSTKLQFSIALLNYPRDPKGKWLKLRCNQKASCGVSWRFKQPKLHVTGPSIYILLGMGCRFWYLGTALGSSKRER